MPFLKSAPARVGMSAVYAPAGGAYGRLLAFSARTGADREGQQRVERVQPDWVLTLAPPAIRSRADAWIYAHLANSRRTMLRDAVGGGL